MNRQRKAALRIAEELVKAAQGSYYAHGWAHYLDREDVEALLVPALTVSERQIYKKLVQEALSA